MKKFDLYVVLSIFAAALLLEAICYSFNKHALPFLWQSPHVESAGERDLSLFSKLDPMLGYAHNFASAQKPDSGIEFKFNHLEAYRDLKNGFIVTEYKPTEVPLKIVILGSSTADPFMYEGNWPWQFHQKLTELNQPHIIYNGAVSGYNSSQMLIKLFRDVFNLQKIDMIIVSGGLSDAPYVGDSVEENVAINPYQLEIVQKYAGEKTFNPKELHYFPNIQWAFHHLLHFLNLNSPTRIVLGVENKDPQRTLTNSVQSMKALADLHGVKFYYFFQPFNFVKHSELIKTRNIDNEYPIEAYENIIKMRQSTLAALKKDSYVFDHQQALTEACANLFRDMTHMNISGNLLLADYIVAQLFPNLVLSNPSAFDHHKIFEQCKKN